MPDYHARQYRVTCASVKSGVGIANHDFTAMNDGEAIETIRAHWAATFDPETDTVYLWIGNHLVWGDGLKG